MPELPEVESVRRLMERTLVGSPLVDVEVVSDDIVFSGHSVSEIEQAFLGKTIQRIGRRGKFFWWELDSSPVVLGHLGMAGWIRQLGAESMRLHSHGEAPLDDESGRPRFLKLRLKAASGGEIGFTDSRRFARVWLAESADRCSRLAKLGVDAYAELPEIGWFTGKLGKRKAPIKAVLLDQGLVSGIGNWIADEVLYRAQIAPARLASSLSEKEVAQLVSAIRSVLDFAVAVDADYTKFPEDWLFHHRWGGGRGAELISGREIQRDTVGGRTTAWVPAIQR